jgi:hypothetical protein
VAGELEAFANWFADWWLRRGRHLTSTDHSNTSAPPDGSSDVSKTEIRE